MEGTPIIELQMKTALAKFGAGNHKPGSGSAVALQGMLAAQLIKTVIDLSISRNRFTCDKKDLDFINNEIEKTIYPTLEKLLEEDAAQFDKVIAARTNRDNAQTIELQNKYSREGIAELRIATEIPIVIAKHCIRLSDFALFIFDNAFQTVRGDSSVAINGAISAVAGSLSIINLNLLSIPSDDWAENIRSEAELLMIDKDRLLSEENERQKSLKDESDQLHNFHLEIIALQKSMSKESNISSMRLEKFVKDFQNTVWDYRDALWKKDISDNPRKILNAKHLLQKMGYQYKQSPSLGQNDLDGDFFEVAGLIDTGNKYVAISENFSPETISFTIAHELAHALLHPDEILHRDRPLDGSTITAPRPLKEKQADKFAAYFLMPAKQVTSSFEAVFRTKVFSINQETATALGLRVADLRQKCTSLRELSILLASSEFYNGKAFISLARQYRVSERTMAIRLEELKLVAF